MSGIPTAQNSKSVYHKAERKKSNLAFAFFCLDKSRATDMEVFYAFCRLMDDIADDEDAPVDVKRELLGQWKAEINSIYSGGGVLSPLGEELKEMVLRRRIPKEYLVCIIDGVLRDTSDEPFETFEDLRRYCYGVASAVGLASIYIFGFKNPLTKKFAEALGYALQFTNILRDVVDDMRSHGRVYIPQRELEAFGVCRQDLANPGQNPACRELFSLMYFRAKHFFNKARRLLCGEDRRNLAPALIMWAIYEDILEKLKARNFDIPASPLKISKYRKIYLALRAIADSKKKVADGCLAHGKVAVVGAGISGTAAAVKLCRDGFDVELFESRGDGGGRTAAIMWAGARLDNASHALMGCYWNFFGLVREVGNNPEDYFSPIKRMDFLYKNRRETVNFTNGGDSLFAGTLGFLKYAGLSAMRSAANVFLLLRMKCGCARALENETAADYLKRMGIGDRAIETFWSPFCVSALNTPIDSASAGVLRETLLKSVLKDADAGRLYVPTRPIWDSVFPKAGLLIEACGGALRFGEAVESVEFSGSRAKGILLKNGGREEFDWVVCAVPPRACGKILNALPAAVELCAKMRENPIVNVYFTTRKKLTDADCACLVDSELHWIFDHTRKLGGESGLFLYGVTVSDKALKKGKQEAAEFVRGELSAFFGQFEIVDIAPMTFESATPSADCKTERARPGSDAFGCENLRVVGDWTATGLPSTLESAAKSAFNLELK